MTQLRQALVAAVPHLAMIDELPVNSGAPLPQKTLGQGGVSISGFGSLPHQPDCAPASLMAELSASAKAHNNTSPHSGGAGVKMSACSIILTQNGVL